MNRAEAMKVYGEKELADWAVLHALPFIVLLSKSIDAQVSGRRYNAKSIDDNLYAAIENFPKRKTKPTGFSCGLPDDETK